MTVILGSTVPATCSFKYLGSTIEATRECGAYVDNRVRSAGNSWKGLSGAICNKKVRAKLNTKLYKTVIKPTQASESWALHRVEPQRIHTNETQMLRRIQGKTRYDRIRNEMFKRYAMVKPITIYVTQKRL